MKNKVIQVVEPNKEVRKVFLISVPTSDGKSHILKMTEDLTLVTSKYPNFVVQQIEVIE